MNEFNYSKLHIFDKNGIELPLTIESSAKITIPSRLGSDAVFYPITDKDKNIIDCFKESSGSRFNGNSTSLDCDFGGNPARVEVSYSRYTAIDQSDPNVSADEYSIDSIEALDSIPIELEYPSIKFNSYLNFNTISAELVETESLYVLVQDEKTKEYVTISEYDSSWGSRYELLFFIDCRNQNDFRFFKIENDELVWSNKTILNLTSAEEDGCRVNIGFCSEKEGIFKEPLYICILDRGENKELPLEEADITFLGTIELQAETIGEDERYRTLFANFGIPDPITYPNLFTNTSIEEDKIDYIKLNQNSKKMFLEYANIFPYAGTYKALTNAVKVLGYDDVFFKEWYKKIDATSSRLMSYDITYNSDLNANVINNVSFRERIHLKKLNWLSMVYRINQEIINSVDDKYGFPEVENKYDFNHEDIVVKLIALRDWLQKYIIGLNCRIIDVGGEGIYFERYKLGTYGSYQTVYEWNNEQDISPFIVDTNDNILIDSSADIYVNLGINEKYTAIEDFDKKRFIDFAEGYFTEDSSYHIGIEDNDESVLWVGKTLTSFTDLNRYQIRASISTENFMFSHSDNIDECYIDSSSSRLVISENKMFLNPLDIHNGKMLQANFVKCPYLYIKKAMLYPYNEEENTDWLDASAAAGRIDNKDYSLLYPTADAEFVYKEDPHYGYPVLMFKNYNVSSVIEETSETEFIIEILDGKILFNESSDDYDKHITVNIQYNNTADKHIVTNIVYLSNEIFPKKYIVGESQINNFIDNEEYPEFIEAYNANPEDCIQYDFVSNIKVNYAGTYTIDVLGKDLYNNIFAASCKNKAVIGTPRYDSIAYANTFTKDVSTRISPEDRSFIKDNYINYCIYNKEYPVPFVKDENGNINYSTYSYAINSPVEGDYVHFSNKQEKFELYGENPIVSTGSSTSKSYIANDTVYSSCTGYDITLKRKNAWKIYNYNTDKNSTNNVNVVFYNELGGYPIFQTFATLKEEENDIYKLSIVDDTSEDYIWAKGDTLGGSAIAEDLASLTIQELRSMSDDPEKLKNIFVNIFHNEDVLEITIEHAIEYIREILDKEYLYAGLERMYRAIGDKVIDSFDNYISDDDFNKKHFVTTETINGEETLVPLLGRFETIEDVITEATNKGMTGNNFIADFAAKLTYDSDSNRKILKPFYDSCDRIDFSDDMLKIKILEQRQGAAPCAVNRFDLYFYRGVIEKEMTLGENSLIEQYHQEYDASIHEYITDNVLVNLSQLISKLNVYTTKFNEFTINDELIESTIDAIIKYSCKYDSNHVINSDSLDPLDRVYIDKMQECVASEFKQYSFTDTYRMLGTADDIYWSLDDNTVVNALKEVWEDAERGAISSAEAYRTCVIFVYSIIGYLTKKYYLNSKRISLGWFIQNDMNFDFTGSYNDSARLFITAVKHAMTSYFFNLGSSDNDIVGKGFRGLVLTTQYPDVAIRLGESLRMYVLVKEQEELQKTNGWITSLDMQAGHVPEATDDQTQRKNAFYYAVAYYDKEQQRYYYIRTKSMADVIAKYLNNDFDGNFIFDLNVLLDSNEIGIYIEPLEKDTIHLSDSTTENSDLIKQQDMEPLGENEMRVRFTTNKHINVEVGDIVKLIFNSIDNNSLIAQSSYKVIKNNPTDNTCILSGNINNQYIKIINGYVFYRTDFVDFYNDSSTDSSIGWKLDEQIILVLDKDDEDNMTEFIQVDVYKHPDGRKYYVTNKLPNGNKEWYRILTDKDNNFIFINQAYNETIEISMAHAHWAYVDYVLKAKMSDETSYPKISVQFDDNVYNNNRLNFIDSKFLLNTRSFNTNQGIASWMDLLYPGEAIKQPFGGTPYILDGFVYKYDKTTRNPIVTQSSPNLVYCVDYDLKENEYVYWRVYKHSTVANERIYEFESFNKVLYLDENVPGIYDIEMNVIDKFGNVSTNLIKGAFQVI